MKFKQILSIQEVSELLSAPFKGNPGVKITGINEIHKVEPGDIVFVDHPKYYKKALNSLADIIIIDQEVEVPEGKAIIISEQPFDDFNKLTQHFAPINRLSSDRGDDVKIGDNTTIHPNAVIGHNVSIGHDCMIHSGVSIADDTIIKNGVEVGPNSVIGHDAFYYKKKKDGYTKMHSCGRVILEDNVEIGALSTIDKGVTGDTIIGEGTKIDNQVHIGHDTVVGKHCLFAANVGVAGCVIIEDNVTLWGQVGVASDLTISENVTILAQSGVGRNMPPNATYFGSPARDARTVMKEMAALRSLPTIIENL